nr:hypothetical protein [Nitrosomonas nitrosa]
MRRVFSLVGSDSTRAAAQPKQQPDPLIVPHWLDMNPAAFGEGAEMNRFQRFVHWSRASQGSDGS